MDFSQRLKELRQNKGLTQAELGKKLGLHNSTISMYERGKCCNFSEKLQQSCNTKSALLFHIPKPCVWKTNPHAIQIDL